MTESQWTVVDEYLESLFLPLMVRSRRPWPKVRQRNSSDKRCSESGETTGTSRQDAGSRRILEIGTLGGYSTIWLARALPSDGTLVTLELESLHAEVARKNIDRADLGRWLTFVLVGDAVVARLIDGDTKSFDFIFIDADKEGYPNYLVLSLQLSRPGTIIVADNVIRDGEVANSTSADERVNGVRAFLEMAAASDRVEGTAIQTVGSKGYDGFALLVVTR